MRELLLQARGETWAINANWLARSLAVADTVRLSYAAARRPEVRGEGRVVVLPLYGMISQRDSVWNDVFGGTSTQGFGAAYVHAVNDPGVQSVVIDIDSPGGTTAGVEELADIIHQGSQIKRTYAVANSTAASAAYWLGSQVGKHRFYAAPGSDVGSIGVFRMHEDVSGMLAQEGIKVTFVQAGRYKTEANPFEPLTREALEFQQTQVDATYAKFLAHVARGRGTTAERVRTGFGEGRMFHANQATSNGMADGVRTLGHVLVMAGAPVEGGNGTSAAGVRLERALYDAWVAGCAETLQRPADRFAHLLDDLDDDELDKACSDLRRRRAALGAR